MADGVVTEDGEMRIPDLNCAGEKLTGFRREEALERFCREVLKSSLGLALTPGCACWKTGVWLERKLRFC